ncbi:RdgB/HAM1 family non-canonical purine NTP pyrophosphatase [Spectribacter hydrogenoxidans]|uniref:dITP/XTP pyrophosphatase n=1 Tax=Spectribacter hydrogenoxidans TaxID=3075608 RepID=A0ABU3BWU2_9GAMM|nr:RdgB/HAM1 family non-canonical purine NTP pyrophosphatase [Salinisphaera sp. W335]MDT0633768.1 RdgB/HAM1 family non-canonical purine NTP pyrophosphatase [Salinisphaera sp. W335]
MTDAKKLVLASSNAGKLAELQAMLDGRGIEVLPQSAFDVPDAPETAPTFVENALIKARHVAGATGLPALADDSGLCVDALDGAPGVHSARYAGEHGNDEANNAKLLSALSGLDPNQREAHFHCTVVLVRHAEDPDPAIAQGRWAGRILDIPRGEGGFGYDPLFWVPAESASAAELAPEHKNHVSHRGQAMRALLTLLGSA